MATSLNRASTRGVHLRSRRGQSIGCALAFLPALAVPPPAGAQELDAGNLRVSVDGRRVGTERFRVWRTGSTVNAVARIEIVQRTARQVGLQTDPALRPVQYEVREGRATLVSGQRYTDRVRFHFTADGGEGWKEYPAQEADAILGSGVAHHYLLLVRALLESPGERLAVLLPLEGRSVTARIAGRTGDSVSIGEASVAATRYDLDIDGAAHRVWLDADDRLLRVLDPDGRREAIRAATAG